MIGARAADCEPCISVIKVSMYTLQADTESLLYTFFIMMGVHAQADVKQLIL